MLCVDSLRRVWGSGLVLCVRQSGVQIDGRDCAVCGTVCAWFGGVIVCCLWKCLWFVCGSKFLLCVGQIGAV